MNLLNLIDSISKSWIQNNSRKYIELFEKNIVSTFVRIYIQSSHSEILRGQLRLLRMTWRKIFQEVYLREMRVKILDIEKEDIEASFSEDDLRKLYEYYKKNDISLDYLPKINKPAEVLHDPNNISMKNPQKRPRNSNSKDIDDPKIKKKLKKAPINNKDINSVPLIKSLNPSLINTAQKIPNISIGHPIPNTNFNNLNNPNMFPSSQLIDMNEKKNKLNMNIFNNNEKEKNIEKNIVAPKKNVPINIQQTNNNANSMIANNNNNNHHAFKKAPDEKKVAVPKENIDDVSKEKLKSLISNFLKENNFQIFFYILYKNFKDEMSRQFPKKVVQISNLKM